MTIPEFIQLAYQYAVGEATAPDIGTENYNLLFKSGNAFIETWQDEPGVDWESLAARMDLDDSVTATDTFDIDPRKVRKLSTKENGVRITAPNGSIAYFKVVKPSKLYLGGNRVAKVGRTIKFSAPFTADSPLFGGTINIPYYGFAPKLSTANPVNNTVPVDQPMWLVYMAAAEFARNDYTKQNQAPALIDLATDVMKSMIKNNDEEEDGVMSHGDFRPLGATT